jgi:hypothetical protein
MDFTLIDELNELLKIGKIEQAIEVTESKLRLQINSGFHKILGRDLLDMTEELSESLEKFHKSANKYFKSENIKINGDKELKSIYCEMNGFTINCDLWFVCFFAFPFYNGMDDLDWTADFEFDSFDEMTIIKGYEDLQIVYEENNEDDDNVQEEAYFLCEQLIILRLQQLFRNAYFESKKLNYEWTKIPVLVTAHDSNLIFNSTM